MQTHELFDPATYECTPGNNAESFPANPAPPQDSAARAFLAHFDGWGYTHLYRNRRGDLARSTTSRSRRRSTSAT